MIRGGDTWKKARAGEALGRVKRQEPGLVANDFTGGNDENLEPDLRLKVARGEKDPQGWSIGCLAPSGAFLGVGSVIS